MSRLWIVLSIIAALSLSTGDLFTKKALSKHDEYIVAWLKLLVFPVLFWVVFLFVPMPDIQPEFYISLSLAIPLEIVAVILYTKALKISPLSLTVPFLSLTPVFLIGISALVFSEVITRAGILGILLIAAGGYTLNIGQLKNGIMEPLLSIRRERGALYMIAVAFIYSLTSTFCRWAIDSSSALFFGLVYSNALVLAYAPIALYKNRNSLHRFLNFETIKAAAIPGAFEAVSFMTTVIAMGLGNLAYVIAVKRLSLLIGVIYGRIYFGEPLIRDRLIAAALMLTGFVVIVLFR